MRIDTSRLIPIGSRDSSLYTTILKHNPSGTRVVSLFKWDLSNQAKVLLYRQEMNRTVFVFSALRFWIPLFISHCIGTYITQCTWRTICLKYLTHYYILHALCYWGKQRLQFPICYDPGTRRVVNRKYWTKKGPKVPESLFRFLIAPSIATRVARQCYRWFNGLTLINSSRKTSPLNSR